MEELEKKQKQNSPKKLRRPSEFSQKLLNLCESAYSRGIPPYKIHSVLSSPKILKLLEEQEVEEEEEREEDSKREAFKYATSSIFVAIVVASIITIVGHFWLCVYLLEINPLAPFPSLQSRRCLLPSHPLLMEMVRPIANCSFCRSTVIELERAPSAEEFQKIAYSFHPIIIRGGNGGVGGGASSSNYTAAPTLTFEKLKEIFESEDKGVETVLEECQFLPFRSPFSSLKDVFEGISAKGEGQWERPWYIGWSNCHPGVASKLREIIPRPSFIPGPGSAIDWIFLGSPGQGAAMHIDYVRRPSWQLQLQGIKSWLLRPPPECEAECHGSGIQMRLAPGDLLCLNTNVWYHETFIEGEELSISIGSEYD